MSFTNEFHCDSEHVRCSGLVIFTVLVLITVTSGGFRLVYCQRRLQTVYYQSSYQIGGAFLHTHGASHQVQYPCLAHLANVLWQVVERVLLQVN